MGSGCAKGEREQPERHTYTELSQQHTSASEGTSGQSGSEGRSSGPERKPASGVLSVPTASQQGTVAVSEVQAVMAESNPSTVIIVLGASVRAIGGREGGNWAVIIF